MRQILISDFTINEVPHGGSEWVNQVLIDKLGLEFEYSSNVTSFDKNAFYIISNISLMNPTLINKISELNYIILENDYKICATRHPWRYKDNIVPLSHRTNYDLYKNAKAVFVQTNDHMQIFMKNNVEGNFISLSTSIWSDSDLDMLSELAEKNKDKNPVMAIYDTENWIKNTPEAIKYCEERGIEFVKITNKKNRLDFLSELAKASGLVFFPIARETFCRFVVEAKCLGLSIITTKNYGAVLEPWFNLRGQKMIDYLREKTEENIMLIKETIQKHVK